MNRFEALHVLGLEEDASDDDVRLACYGICQAIAACDFSDADHIGKRIALLDERAREAKTFLLKSRNKTAARKVRSYSQLVREQREKPKKTVVTPEEQKHALLEGFEHVRASIVGYMDNERSKRRSWIVVLLVCILVGFIGLRYFRGGVRVAAFAVIGAIAVAGSTLLTAAHVQVRKSRAHILTLDEQILELRHELGLQDPEEDGYVSDEARRLLEGAELPEGEDPDDEGFSDTKGFTGEEIAAAAASRS